MNPLSSSQLYWRLLRQVKPYYVILIVSLCAMAISALTEPLLSALMAPLIDRNFVNSHVNDSLWQVPLAIVGVAVLRAISSFVNDYTMSWLSSRVVFDLRQAMFNKLLNLPIRYYDAHANGVLTSKVAFDVSQVTAAGVNVITVVVKDSLTLIGLLGWMFWLNWQLSLVCLAVLPAVGVSVRFAAKRLRGLSRGAQAAMGGLTQLLGESIGGHRVIKVFGGVGYESSRFSKVNNTLRALTVKQAVASALNSGIVQLLVTFALAVIVYFASIKAQEKTLSAGDFVSFLTAMLMILAPVKRITGVNEALQRGLAAAESVFSLIDEEPEVDTGQRTMDRAKGSLVFEHVNLQYGMADAFALKNINLHIPAGQTIALVGSSGSGKTSLVNLIPRFYEPVSGHILLDGIATKELGLSHLRAQIAMVSQDVMLFNDSIAANIAYGRMGQVSDQDIVEAARSAYALEFIEEMPEGFNTIIGDNGVRLSGGQRQRLAIARAFLKNAPILILDEATSALDTQSERFVQAALEKLMKGRTTIVIAHRLSTIENADHIVVMQKGEIVEEGSHQELLLKAGVYARLHSIQFQEVQQIEV